MGATALIGGLVGGGLSLFGASEQANAQESAASTSADANTAAAQLQYQEWLQQQKNMQPWLTAGTGAVNSLAAGVSPGGQFTNIPKFSFDPTQIANDPDYQFVRSQGLDALTAKSAAAGNYGSGNMGTALENYGSGLASQYENQYYNQALDTYGQNLNSQYTMPYNMLAGVSGTGQTAANSLANTGQAAVSNMGNYGVSAANALGAGQIGAANAYTGGLNSIMPALLAGTGYGAYGYGGGYGGYNGGNALTAGGYNSDWYGGAYPGANYGPDTGWGGW